MHQRQTELEDAALANGALRFRKRLEELSQEGDATAEGAARKLLQKVLSPTKKAFDEILVKKDRRGYGTLIRWLQLVGTDVAAYITIRTLLGHPHIESNISKLAPTIARLLNDELRYRKLRTEARGLFEYRMRQFNTSNYKHRAHSLNQAARYAGVEDDANLTDREAMLLGLKLINVCLDTTGIGRLTNKKRKKGQKWSEVKTFALTEETQQLLEDTNDIMQWHRPQALPMVEEPLPWTQETNGGYRYALRDKYPLVRKTSNARVRQVDMPFVYEGLNRMQSTAWRVNQRVLDVVLDLRERGSSLGGLPDAEPEPMPPKHPWMKKGIQRHRQTEEQQKQLREWKRAASEIKERNNLRASRLIEWFTAIELAEQFAQYDRIWFPHNLDFRGRAYPICSGLQPQGSDLQRGLLCFSASKPLNTTGATWLAIHGANTLGEFDGHKFSKESFEQRAQWIRANTEAIRAVAKDPAGITWWSEADKPFQFLAFAIEWNAYMEADAVGNGERFRSSLPIAQDGTCNGLQHFAALLRDPRGAREVNLTEESLPRDVYDAIHSAVRTLVARDAATGMDTAKWWLHSGLLSRSLFKRPTMTFAYGSKTFGMARQIEESLVGEDNWQEINQSTFELDNGSSYIGPLCRYLAGLIWTALEDVVVAAFGGMEWLAECAGAVCDERGFVEWTVPVTGFPARQEYWNMKRHRVQTILCGSIVTLSTWRKTKKALRIKHKNSIAPNVIHSLDAAAMMMTLVLASRGGIDAFGMVHDSYSTHACDASTMAEATREAFISLYDGRDVIDLLYRSFSSQAEVPLPPPKGTFNVQQVRTSRYFFS